MKAITILQPWASLIACGEKKIETRGWPTKYRGPIAIHAGNGKKYVDLSNYDPFFTELWNSEQIKIMIRESINALPYGAVIAVADLIVCEKMTMNKIILWRDIYGKNELAFGDFTHGRYAWILDNVRQVNPVPARGKQRIWEWEKERSLTWADQQPK